MNFYNNGLYIEAFYTKQYINFFKKDTYLFKEVKYNRELFIKHYKKKLEGIDEEYERLEEIDRIFQKSLSYYNLYFYPLIFDEKIALKCGLIPFEYQTLELLALPVYGIDFSSKFDAYQVLTHNTIDQRSKIFTSSGYREDFENIVGKEITRKILQMKPVNEKS